MKFRRASCDVLYVPLYLRSFNVTEKVIVTVLIFLGSLTVGLIPIFSSSTDTIDSTTTKTYSSEVKLWDVLGEKD
ncbi:MAG: hypothetical protein AAF298_24500 [Cyanobacteria bacterium P01_A01_bin.40]